MTAMAKGQSLRLNASDQLAIAGWMAKTALLLTFSVIEQGEVNYEPTRARLINMMASGRPPSETSVRLMRIDPHAAGANPLDDAGYLFGGARPPAILVFGVATLSNLAWEVSHSVMRTTSCPTSGTRRTTTF
jgi:hypothetical protein